MNYTREQWARALLAAIGNTKPSTFTLTWVISWTTFETNEERFTSDTAAKYNLLNTTQEWVNGVQYMNLFNDAGVCNYPSFEIGVAANATCLVGGPIYYYPALLKALQTNDDAALMNPSAEIQHELDVWGTGHALAISAAAVRMIATHELPNFPLLNQLAETDINRSDDCVPTTLAGMLEYLTGKKHTGTELKDAIYGTAYVGVTDPAMYVSYIEQFGVTLSPFTGTNAQLVAEGHRQIALGHPLGITEIDSYINPNPTGITHFLCWYADGPGYLKAADPMGGITIMRTDADWANNWLRDGQIWIMTRKEQPVIPSGFDQFFVASDTPDTDWARKDNPTIILTGGILTWYQSIQFGSEAGLSLCGLPVANQMAGSKPGTFTQEFERAVVVFDPQRQMDNPPGSKGDCYLQHIETFYQASTSPSQAENIVAAIKKLVETV